MLKKDLRSDYKIRRESISNTTLLNLSLGIANGVLKLPLWSSDYFHIFLPISERKEIDTTFILSILQGKDKHIVLPKLISNGLLKHYLLTDATKLKKNRWGIPEPVEGIEIPVNKIDVVFVPLLAYDKKGNRVGYGKGFYDRFLSQCRTDTIKVGLSLFDPEEFISDANKYDVSLDYCITPDKNYSFSKD
ncbi:MAG: 5-formyltetrahydrofolate cyclo-ligase [Pricia sp.]|nr:5-formyltetrahydrofolate cyclo-ligase [Pricia sp.]